MKGGRNKMEALSIITATLLVAFVIVAAAVIITAI